MGWCLEQAGEWDQEACSPGGDAERRQLGLQAGRLGGGERRREDQWSGEKAKRGGA